MLIVKFAVPSLLIASQVSGIENLQARRSSARVNENYIYRHLTFFPSPRHDGEEVLTITHGGDGALDIMHRRSRMTIDPRRERVTKNKL